MNDCRTLTGTEIICDSEEMDEFPSGNGSYKLNYFQMNGTKVRKLNDGDFLGQYIEMVAILDNPINELDLNAFTGLQGTKYLSLKKNRIRMHSYQNYNLFLPYRELNDLSVLILDDNRYNLSRAFLGEETYDAGPLLPCLESLSLRGNPLTSISNSFFTPLACSPLKELILKDCDIEYIEDGNIFLHSLFVDKFSIAFFYFRCI